MKSNEKKLFLLLCSFRAPDKKSIEYCLNEGAATSSVLGLLFANRMAGVAYHVLEKCDLLGKVEREFRNSLRNAATLNERMNRDYFENEKALASLLETCEVKYALLKGAYLCHWYPRGCRTSNDVDVLVKTCDISKIAEKLKGAGFRQGHIRNGHFTPATRNEIVESKMTRGETVPFIKEVGYPFLRYLEVDLNFSLDYKNGNSELLERMLGRTIYRTIDSMRIRTLDSCDFILHLCSHLYKEATTYAWIQMKRDMTFYKYCDIYAMIHDLTENQYAELVERAHENGQEKELAYCMFGLKSFWGDVFESFEAPYLSKEDLDYIVVPEKKKTYCYNITDFRERFFEEDRQKFLQEVSV